MSFDQIISSLKCEEEAFLNVLLVGEDLALSSREIEQLTGYNPRIQRLLVSGLRKKHIPVCSTSNGYFIASTEEDIQSSINIIHSHVCTEKDTIRNLEKCKQNIEKCRSYYCYGDEH